MKKILFSIIILLTAIVTMAYLYFSKLNTAHASSDLSLYAAVSKSGFVFSFENDKSILDIFKGQDSFEEIIGADKAKEMQSLKTFLLSSPGINKLFHKQTIYLSFIPEAKEINYLLSTQSETKINNHQLFQVLKSRNILLDKDNASNTTKITLPDSTVFYLGVKDQLVLLSNTLKPVKELLSKTFDKKDDKFVAYIKSGSKLSKNSLAQLYLDFNRIPTVLKTIMPGKLTGELAVLNHQNAFALLSYNFSKERVLFTGTTHTNDPHSYYQLFSETPPQKITINTILPEQTANYNLYAVDNYANWRKKLDQWFTYHKEDKKRAKLIEDINQKYHLNLEALFPKYFRNQFLNFQLSNTEKLGAINLTNGDKLNQLLLDLSENYSDDIKQFKEADILYAYFGMPFKDYKKPYYLIIDNYLVFSNHAGPLQGFLNDYRNNKLLINTHSYTNVNNQLPNNSNINFYVDHQNSTELLNKNIYLPYLKHLQSEKGLKQYEAFVYQLSGDNGTFQSNILLSKPLVIEKDF
ncbi:hypothetical protein [Pedobacter caeni]|uniref:DUF3352 domain-containing protein n=1 Tax=Pedobacter caeni TaxID=288992 RepID=A0A1M5GAC0_9SPHI|nr:hypothetical protein [Pedobacter caeni]SHG00618.1 hypothetical protein SAMN04488522_104130 [Pedobacter caeni]